MEEIEVPTDEIQDKIKEKLEEERREKKEQWTMYLAISTALMAVFAALGSLFAGHHSNEALIAQIRATDAWSYYQAKGIKYEVTSVLKDIQAGNDAEAAKLDAKLKSYTKEQAEVKTEASQAEEESANHLQHHVTLARSVTIFQISIAISAIAMLTRRKFLWYGSMVFSIGGVILFIIGLL